MTNDENFFDKFNLGVKEAADTDIELGKQYPIYGMITSIVEEKETEMIVVINYNIQATLNIGTPEKVQTVKERAFEPGIFITTFTKKFDLVEGNPIAYAGDVSTVVFGRKQAFSA